MTTTTTRALVLGGGGVTGIGWEIGVLAGLADAGLEFTDADLIIGTSAGSFVGVAVASGYPMATLFAEQLEPADTEVDVAASPAMMAAWANAFAAGGGDPAAVGRGMGAIGEANPAPVPPEVRRRVVVGRLKATTWPSNLAVAAINAATGELHLFRATDGVPLVDAVATSGAVPGVWPTETISGTTWVDGGMVSTANAREAAGFDRVVILAPMPAAVGALPGVADDAAELGKHAQVQLVVPDAESVGAIGPNPYDPARRAPAAEAGRAQGARIASQVAAIW